jgi:hypothetical protein
MSFVLIYFYIFHVDIQLLIVLLTEIDLFFIVLILFFCQRSVNHIYVGWFLASMFSCMEPFVFSFIHSTLSWLTKLYKVLSQVVLVKNNFVLFQYCVSYSGAICNFHKKQLAVTFLLGLCWIYKPMFICLFSIFWDRVFLCSPGWPGTHCEAQAGLKLECSYLSHEVLGCRPVPPCPRSSSCF